MKKISVEIDPRAFVQIKDQIEKSVQETINQLNQSMTQLQQDMSTKIMENMRNAVEQLNKSVETELGKIQRIVTVAPVTTLPATAGIKISKRQKDKPSFWLKNIDYGESPYMNIGFITEIADKPPRRKKKRKKKKSKNDKRKG